MVSSSLAKAKNSKTTPDAVAYCIVDAEFYSAQDRQTDRQTDRQADTHGWES